MRIVAQLTQTINDYRLDIDGKEYYFKEYLDDRGKVISDELSDGDSLVCEDEVLVERVRKFIDENSDV